MSARVVLLLVTALLFLGFSPSFGLDEPAFSEGVEKNAGYGIPWFSMDRSGGAMQSLGGEYVLRGTLGQPDAAEVEGGAYTLNGGFWGVVRSRKNVAIFSDDFESGECLGWTAKVLN